MSPMPRTPRPEAELEEHLVAAFRAKAGTRANPLCAHWVLQAARMVKAGQGHKLPQERRIASRGGKLSRISWPQDMDEYGDCADLIHGSGSSVAAVLRTAITRYLPDGVNAVTMSWPAKGVLRDAS